MIRTLLGFLVIATGASRQPCEWEWSHDLARLSLDDGHASAMVEWERDGRQVVVLGGTFSSVGDVLHNNIASWDGRA